MLNGDMRPAKQYKTKINNENLISEQKAMNYMMND